MGVNRDERHRGQETLVEFPSLGISGTGQTHALGAGAPGEEQTSFPCDPVPGVTPGPPGQQSPSESL